jgi:hypothetical protein
VIGEGGGGGREKGGSFGNLSPNVQQLRHCYQICLNIPHKGETI